MLTESGSFAHRNGYDINITAQQSHTFRGDSSQNIGWHQQHEDFYRRSYATNIYYRQHSPQSYVDMNEALWTQDYMGVASGPSQDYYSGMNGPHWNRDDMGFGRQPLWDSRGNFSQYIGCHQQLQDYRCAANESQGSNIPSQDYRGWNSNIPCSQIDTHVQCPPSQDFRGNFSQIEQWPNLYKNHCGYNSNGATVQYANNGANSLIRTEETIGSSSQSHESFMGNSVNTHVPCEAENHMKSCESAVITASFEPTVIPASRKSTVIPASCESETLNKDGNCHLVNYLTYLYDLPEESEPNNQDVAITTPLPEQVLKTSSARSTNSFNATVSVSKKPNKNEFGCDNTDMYVETSDQSAKKYCCPFCEKLVSKLPRHMEDVHKEEPDVKLFLSLPKDSHERRRVQDSLRKVGLTSFNKKATLNKGLLITSRRPNKKHKRKAVDHTTCHYCFGSYAKSGLPFHIKRKCPEKPIDDPRTESERVTSSLAAAVEARYREDTGPALQKVFQKLRDDAVVRDIKFDWLAIVYGNRLTAKYTKPRSRAMIQNKMRLIGRVLSALKIIEPGVTELAKLFIPKHYDRVVDAIRAVARVDEVRNEFVAPATASSAVTAIRQIGKMLIVEYIKKDDKENQRITRDFLEIMDSDMHISINKMVTETQSRMARQRIITLPSTNDVKLLAQYVEDQRVKCFNELYDSENRLVFAKWKLLTELTMASIIVFNRRRVGDTENILSDDFAHKEVISHETHEEYYSTLPEKSKQIASQYSRMRVRGKKNRTVPVLLKASVVDCLKEIISKRNEAGISPNNTFLFAMPSKTDDFRVVNAGRILKKFAIASGAENPSLLTATNLRKHLATKCVSMQLNDNSVADVAAFMGHAEKVHRDYYRQNTIDRQVVQMSQLLEAAQGNINIETQEDSHANRKDVNKSRKRKLSSENFGGKRKSQRISQSKK